MNYQVTELNSISIIIGENESITLNVNITKKVTSSYEKLEISNLNETLLFTHNGLVDGDNTITISDSSVKQAIFNSIGSNFSATLTGKVKVYRNSSYTQLTSTTPSLSFTATIPNYTLSFDSVSVADSETDYDTYKPTNTTLIRYLSQPTLTFSASSSTGYNYGKTITYSINDIPRTSPYTDTNFVGNNYNLLATDSRTSVTTTTNLTIVNYVRPTVTCTITRNTSVPTKANVSVSGTYYGGSGLTNLETPTLTLKYTESGSSQVTASVVFTPTLEDGIYSFSEDFELTGLNAKKVLTWEIVLSDLIGIETSATGNLTKQYPLWHGYTDSNNEQVMNIYGDLEISGDYLRVKDTSNNKLAFKPTIVDSSINSLRLQNDNNDNYLPIGITDKTLTLVINGTTYTFDGSVAQNITFNTSKSIITGSLSSDITKTSEGKITLDSFETSVNNSELASNNGGIKINNSSVSRVKVSANIRLTNGSSTQSFNLYIQKNGTTVSSQRLTNLDSSSQGSMSISPILLPVSNGDVITLYLWKGNSNTTTLQADYTNLTVEVVK